jgi:hypothetical protein
MNSLTSAVSLIVLATAAAGITWVTGKAQRGLSAVTSVAPRTGSRRAELVEQTPEKIAAESQHDHMQKLPEGLDTEQAILGFFYSQPEAESLEASSIACRGTTCTMRVLAFSNGKAAVYGAFGSEAIEAILAHYKTTDLSQTLVVDGLSTYYFEDHTLYIIAFERVLAD